MWGGSVEPFESITWLWMRRRIEVGIYVNAINVKINCWTGWFICNSRKISEQIHAHRNHKEVSSAILQWRGVGSAWIASVHADMVLGWIQSIVCLWFDNGKLIYWATHTISSTISLRQWLPSTGGLVIRFSISIKDNIAVTLNITFSGFGFLCVNSIWWRRRRSVRVNRFGVDVVWVKSSPIITPSVILLNSKWGSIQYPMLLPSAIAKHTGKKLFLFGKETPTTSKHAESGAHTEPKIFTTVLVWNSDFLDFPLLYRIVFRQRQQQQQSMFLCSTENMRIRIRQIHQIQKDDRAGPLMHMRPPLEGNAQKVDFMQNECCFPSKSVGSWSRCHHRINTRRVAVSIPIEWTCSVFFSLFCWISAFNLIVWQRRRPLDAEKMEKKTFIKLNRAPDRLLFALPVLSRFKSLVIHKSFYRFFCPVVFIVCVRRPQFVLVGHTETETEYKIEDEEKAFTENRIMLRPSVHARVFGQSEYS